MTQFQELGLSESILRAVAQEGYATPTPIQAQAIPVLLQGRDLVGLAQTGTGKTAAFTLPILQMIEGSKGLPEPKTCRALIVAPTRELAAQILDSVRTYSRFQKISSAIVVGGVKPGPQIKALARGVDVLVATPGRLLDHMATGALNLRGVLTVVLDEADQMMDMGFIPAIRKIMRALPQDRQTMLFSATMPKEIRGLAADFLRDPAEIAVARVGKPIEAINQRVIHVPGADKRDVLSDLLMADDVRQAIVFTRTKRGADRVSEHLEKQGLKAGALHGNKSQGQRDRTLGGFRAGKLKILVATDIAARGIDVDDVSHVINYELPNVPESYVHRIGRTARAGKGGIAIALCDRGEIGLLRDIEKLIKADIPAEGDVPEARPAQPSRNRNGARPIVARSRPSGGRPGGHGNGGDGPRQEPGARQGRPQGGNPGGKPGGNGVRRRRTGKPGQQPGAAAG